MAREVLLYSDIYGWTAERAINELNEVKGSQEVTVRFNGDGGEVRYGWAIIGKTKEIKGKKLFKNDGEANSMMAFAFCYNDNNEAFDTSSFCFHRASYGLAYEKSEYCTESQRQELIDKNAKLRQAMEAKIDVAKFERITGVTLNDMFSMEGHIEARLSASEALEVGLINRVIPITPEYSAQVQALTAHFSQHKIAAQTENQTITMNTTEEIKAKYPDLYKQIYAKGVKRGVEKEYERVAAIVVHAETDPKKVAEAINSRKPLSEADKTSLLMKSITALAAKAIENESADAIPVDGDAASKEKPAASAKSAKETAEAKAFQAALDEEFKKMYPNSKKAAA